MKYKIIPSTFGISSPALDAWKNAPDGLSSIHMPLRGKMVCSSPSGSSILSPGSIYFMANRCSMRFDVLPNCDYYHLFLNFRTLPPLLNREALEIKNEDDPYLFHLMKAVETLMVQQMEATGHNKFRGMSDPLWHQIRPILELIVKHFNKKYQITVIDNPKLEKAVHYIESNFHEPLQNKDIAAQLHIDSRYLIRLFRKHLDMSPHEYLTQCRIEHALTLLQEGSAISETAEKCGYQSENAFRIAFKKYMGVPPTHLNRHT